VPARAPDTTRCTSTRARCGSNPGGSRPPCIPTLRPAVDWPPLALTGRSAGCAMRRERRLAIPTPNDRLQRRRCHPNGLAEWLALGRTGWPARQQPLREQQVTETMPDVSTRPGAEVRLRPIAAIETTGSLKFLPHRLRMHVGWPAEPDRHESPGRPPAFSVPPPRERCAGPGLGRSGWPEGSSAAVFAIESTHCRSGWRPASVLARQTMRAVRPRRRWHARGWLATWLRTPDGLSTKGSSNRPNGGMGKGICSPSRPTSRERKSRSAGHVRQGSFH